MSEVFVDISVSLDGYVAGPNPRLEEPLGDGGEELHEWIFRLEAWRSAHGGTGGERGPESEMVAASVARAGAVVMGRGMFGGGPGPWGDDPWTGWWGDDPPFHKPVFVLTHHPREPLELRDTTFTFVTDGIESALADARSAARGRDVLLAGGGSAIQQGLRIGGVDELNLHVAPVLLGGGVRLFGDTNVRFEQTAALVGATGVAHLRYRRA
jgi:dihydrofolate reductase